METKYDMCGMMQKVNKVRDTQICKIV